MKKREDWARAFVHDDAKQGCGVDVYFPVFQMKIHRVAGQSLSKGDEVEIDKRGEIVKVNP